MVDIRISGLPSEPSPSASDVLPIDGATTRQTTIQAAVEIGRPAASQAEAEAGVNSTKVMTPLTVKQSIAVNAASPAQGAKADSALQPSAIGVSVQAYSANLGTLSGVSPGAAGLAILADVLPTDVRTYIDAAPADFVWRVPLEAYGAVGDGTTDDTAAINTALGAGVPLTGSKRIYGVTGKISLPAGADLEDAEFKQLAPGTALSVTTLEASGVNNVRLVRVKVNRNGDGTNGGFLDGSPGNNGAHDSAFGIHINGGTGHYLQDIEGYGNDSGSLIALIGLDSTTRVIRPYAHDAYWKRDVSTATDDQLQGIYVYQCSDLIIDDARVERLTGIQTGVATPRFTRAIPVGASTALTIRNAYVYKCDQGIDITGSVGNRYIRVEKALLREVYTWTVKLANAAQYCTVSECVSINCGASFVANANPVLAVDIRTSDNLFVDCWAINVGYTGQTVIDADAFRVIDTSTARIKFVRCHAYDFQTVKTMHYAFASHPTGANSSMMQDCDYSGYTTSTPTSGEFIHPEIKTGTNANGRWTTFPDGTLLCDHQIDLTALAVSTARSSLFGSSAGQTWTFPMAFLTGSNPEVAGVFSRNDVTVVGGVSELSVSNTTWTYAPWTSSSVGAGNTKFVRLFAKGRWK